MKFDLSHLERGYHANLLRRRAIEARAIAESRSASATQAELREEADYCERQAKRLDDAEESAAVNGKEPIRAGSRIDIDSVDAPPAK